MTWKILICTLPERFEKLKRLKNILEPQVERFKDKVSIHYHDEGRQLATGAKRNQLVEQTQSDYFNFIDDDDLVSAYYVSSIVNAMQTNPDVITFDGWYTEYGLNRKDFTIRLGSKYYEDPNHKFYYHRFPNHLAVMKRSLVDRIKFPELHQREDYIWAEQIHNRGLLKTEVHIDQFLYHYDCNPVKNERRARVR